MLLELYKTLVSKREQSSLTEDCSPLFLRLCDIEDLHFLDWQALRLLARLSVPCALSFTSQLDAHLASRLAARIVSATHATHFTAQESIEHASVYVHGAILNRVLQTRGWADVWHEYLTSRDGDLPRVAAGKTLGAQFPHLRAGFVTGADLFHQGSFYQAHEDWESLWMRLADSHAEEKIERFLAQALIQLSGAHLHRLKGRSHQARKLYRSASNYLVRVLESDARRGVVAWLDVPKLLKTSGEIFEFCDDTSAATHNIKLPALPFVQTRATSARKHF